MTANSLQELFETGLKKAYYTEQQLVDALEKLESQAVDEEAKQAFSEHREETREHVQRLEEVFKMMDMEPEAETDTVVEALIQEHEEFAQGGPDEKVLERFNIAAGQKTEHIEIAMYGNLTPIAGHLDMQDAADILEKNLREEEEALDKLSQVGEAFDYGEISAE